VTELRRSKRSLVRMTLESKLQPPQYMQKLRTAQDIL